MDQLVLTIITGIVSFAVGIGVVTVKSALTRSNGSKEKEKISRIEFMVSEIREESGRTDVNGIPIRIAINMNLKEITKVLKENGLLLKNLAN